MKDCCRNCHFLARKNYLDNVVGKYEQTPFERRKSLTGPGSCCFHGEWNSTGLASERVKERDVPKFLDQSGRDCFWPYKEGMSFEAGKLRQRKEIEDSRTRKSVCLMKISIFLSAIAALSGLVYVIDLIRTWGS